MNVYPDDLYIAYGNRSRLVIDVSATAITYNNHRGVTRVSAPHDFRRWVRRERAWLAARAPQYREAA